VKVKTASTKKAISRPESAKKTSQSSKNQTKRRKVVTQAKKPTKSIKKSGSLRWHWPTHGHVIETFSSKSSTRKGIDIAGRLGQGVKAASAGRVVYSGSGLRGYGKLIIVKHNEQYLSAYAHNRKLLVKQGDTVKLGQRIAEMGRSGTDRVKLHFEIRREGNPVNPMRYLPKRRG
jgi:lipoprotein NlpD